MTSPRILPDTPVDDVTVERLADIFDEQGLQYRIEGEIFRTGFSNAAIAMQVREKTLIVDSVWRGQVPVSEGPKLLGLVNQWNGEHYAPTLRFLESGETALAVSAVRELHIVHGASRNQLGAFIMSSLNSILESFHWMEEQYPQLVTWKDEHND